MIEGLALHKVYLRFTAQKLMTKKSIEFGGFSNKFHNMRTPIITATITTITTTTATATTIMSVVLLLTTINVTNTSSQEEEKTLIEYPGLLINGKRFDYTLPKERTKRGVFWDLFQKVVITKNLIVDVKKFKDLIYEPQYQDTKDSLNEIYGLISKQFNDLEPTTPSTQETVSATSPVNNNDESSEAQSTRRPYTISRYELGRILGRNYRGLQRLKDVEIRDALNHSHYNVLEYKAEADKQFANSLPLEKKNLIKSFIG
uniref:Uncharacterized protein n=1 Tax=Glossina austeni TaxID=7395 RepID=A0A1A9UEB8_GLOAU